MKYREPKPETVLAATLASEPGEHSIGHYAACDAESLVRLGKRAARIAEQRCNGIERFDPKAGRVLATWTEEDETRADQAAERIRKQAAEILKSYGADSVTVGGDPRGFCLTFRLASGRSNSASSGIWGV